MGKLFGLAKRIPVSSRGFFQNAKPKRLASVLDTARRTPQRQGKPRRNQVRKGILRRIYARAPQPGHLPDTVPSEANVPLQLYVGNTNILPGGIWTSEDGITWTRNDSASDHCVRYENNILTLKNVTILGEFNASGNTSGAGIYAVGQLKQPVSLTIELLGNNTVSGFSGIAVAANHSSGKDASLTIRGSGSLIAEGAGVVDGGIAIRASDGAAFFAIENALVKATGGTSGAGVLLESANNGRAELTVNVSGGRLMASGSDSYGGISYYCGADRAAGHARLKVSGGALVNAVSGIKAVGAALPVPEADNGGGIVFDAGEGAVYGNVVLIEKLVLKEGKRLQIGGGASLNTDGCPIIVERGGRLEGYVTGEAVWKVSSVTLRQNSLSLKQDGTAELQATLDPTATNTNMTWSSIPNGIVQIIQSQTDGTKASIKPLKEGSTTVTVAAEGGQETALCNITVKAVEKSGNVSRRQCLRIARAAQGFELFPQRKKKEILVRSIMGGKAGINRFPPNQIRQAPRPGRYTGQSACF